MGRPEFLPSNEGKIQQGQHNKYNCLNSRQEGFQMQPWHEVLGEGGSQEAVATSQVHRMRGKIKLFVDFM